MLRREIEWTLRRAIAAAALILAAGGVAAQPYPDRPIRIVVPFAPGGGNDILARHISTRLNARWGQPVLVEHKPGAGGNIGAEFVARAAPDGYTLLLATNTLTINPYVFAKVPFDVQKDFEPVALVAATPFVLVVNNALAARSVADLVAHAKANPGRLSYASVGVGTPHHLGMELFKNLTGTDIVHVPYKGSVPALTDTATGQTQVMLATINAAMPFLQGARLRPLAVAEPRRIDAMKDLPTVVEAGVPGFEVSAWYAILAPARTPPEVVRRLGEEILAGFRDGDAAEKLAPAGFEVKTGTAEALRQLIQADLEKWGRVARTAGVKPE